MPENEKKAVLPGLPQMKEKPKEVVTNPTKQIALAELPTVEKVVAFSKELSAMNFSSWLPPDDSAFSEIISEVKGLINIVDIPKVPSAPNRFKKDKKQVNKENIEIPKVPKQKDIPTDMEIALSQVQVSMVQDVAPKTTSDVEMSTEIPIVEVKQKPETNVFETLNSIPIDVGKKVEKRKEKQDTSSAKLIMKIDDVEIKLVQKDSEEPSYMIGRKLCGADEYKQFIQSVSGKILALECKRIEINNNVYFYMGDWKYKDKENKQYSLDDMLELIHI